MKTEKNKKSQNFLIFKMWKKNKKKQKKKNSFVVNIKKHPKSAVAQPRCRTHTAVAQRRYLIQHCCHTQRCCHTHNTAISRCCCIHQRFVDNITFCAIVPYKTFVKTRIILSYLQYHYCLYNPIISITLLLYYHLKERLLKNGTKYSRLENIF